MKQAQFIEKNQDWQNEATTYWFYAEIGGEQGEYGIRETDSSVSVIAWDGREVEDIQLADRVKAACIVTDDIRAA